MVLVLDRSLLRNQKRMEESKMEARDAHDETRKPMNKWVIK